MVDAWLATIAALAALLSGIAFGYIYGYNRAKARRRADDDSLNMDTEMEDGDKEFDGILDRTMDQIAVTDPEREKRG